MNSIITEISRVEHVILSKIDVLFSKFSISRLLKKSNFYKESGIQCVIVLKEIFDLFFSGKNLFRTLDMKPNDISSKKTLPTGFLINVLISDDSIYDRSRSKKVELLSQVFDHTTHKFVKGFNMLTIGWSDGNTFLPAAFTLLSSRHEKKILRLANGKIDKHSAGYKKRTEAIANATDILMKLFDVNVGAVIFNNTF